MGWSGDRYSKDIWAHDVACANHDGIGAIHYRKLKVNFEEPLVVRLSNVAGKKRWWHLTASTSDARTRYLPNRTRGTTT